MSYTNMTEVIHHGRLHGYTVGAFNIMNLEMVQAVIAAANAQNVGVILQVYWENDLDHIGRDNAVQLVKLGAQQSSVPIALQLDHGPDYQLLIDCIDAGFSSVMADFSSLPYEENVEMTKSIVAYAHRRNVTVEAELGKIVQGGTNEEIALLMTDPEQVTDFVDKTGIDAIAVAVGTAHGIYTEVPKIDFPRLARILEHASCPVVIHGGSKIPEEDVAQMVNMGIGKMNIGYDLMNAYQQAVKESSTEEQFILPVKIFSAGREAVYTTVCRKIQQLSR